MHIFRNWTPANHSSKANSSQNSIWIQTESILKHKLCKCPCWPGTWHNQLKCNYSRYTDPKSVHIHLSIRNRSTNCSIWNNLKPNIFCTGYSEQKRNQSHIIGTMIMRYMNNSWSGIFCMWMTGSPESIDCSKIKLLDRCRIWPRMGMFGRFLKRYWNTTHPSIPGNLPPQVHCMSCRDSRTLRTEKGID